MVQYFLSGVSGPWVIELKSGVNRLGRNPSNDFSITEPSISSFHCEIRVSEQGLFIVDLESTNGTFIDGQMIKEGTLLPGQSLRLGSIEFRVDAREFVVAIPELSKPEGPSRSQLLDGSPACLNHPGEAALWKCQQCGEMFCAGCVRTLKRTGGKVMTFCTVCPGQCQPLPSAAAKKAKSSFFGRLTQTLRLTFKI
jgi:pSer/pThr/pTyr-binding forkhead associated (FHA) protein